MVNADLALRPCEAASSAIAADRLMSSYDELVHDPMRPTLSSAGQECFLTSEANLEIGVARSGVKGPLICGSRVSRFCSNQLNYFRLKVRTISILWSYSHPSSGWRLCWNCSAYRAIGARLVASR